MGFSRFLNCFSIDRLAVGVDCSGYGFQNSSIAFQKFAVTTILSHVAREENDLRIVKISDVPSLLASSYTGKRIPTVGSGRCSHLLTPSLSRRLGDLRLE